jgi:hypothetical protein
MPQHPDIPLLRDLAARYLAQCTTPEQQRRRDLWRAHNSLVPTRPPIYVRAIPWGEVPAVQAVQCTDPFYQGYERHLRQALYRGTIADDFIYEPWLVVGAACVTPPGGIWGVEVKRIATDFSQGAAKFDPPLKALADLDRLVAPHHRIDEGATRQRLETLQAAVGDILPVVVDRAPVYRVWNGDISTQLAHLRGLEQVMWDMADEPEWLHRLLAFMRDGILTTHAEAERAGDWRLLNHENQAMAYAQELPDPSADPTPVPRKALWCFVAAQELTLVSPAMHDAFMLQYQLPIMREFGLVSYGCCEDLTDKIALLRQIPNLRRIAVAPSANVRRCAEQIGTDYVLSYRPSPAEMVCCGFDPAFVRRTIREALATCAGCHVDITLKDVETVQGDPDRLHTWAQIVREEVE